LMGDDGLGLTVLERLRGAWELPPDVLAVDGGTWGMNLLPLIESADDVIILDAIDSGAPSGTVTVLEGHDLPRYFAHKLSPHQIDLREVLALTELRGTLPTRLAAIGVQPDQVEMTTRLSESVGRAVTRVVELVVERLERSGHHCTPRVEAAHA